MTKEEESNAIGVGMAIAAGITATPDQLVEIGIGYIAKGVFRADKESGPEEAAQLGLDAINAVRAIWLDFETLRKAKPA